MRDEIRKRLSEMPFWWFMLTSVAFSGVVCGALRAIYDSPRPGTYVLAGIIGWLFGQAYSLTRDE